VASPFVWQVKLGGDLQRAGGAFMSS